VHRTWSIRTVSPFTVPLALDVPQSETDSSTVHPRNTSLESLEEKLTLRVRQSMNTSAEKHQASSNGEDEGTFVTLSWINSTHPSTDDPTDDESSHDATSSRKRPRLELTSPNGPAYHLYIDVRICDGAAAELLLCFPRGASSCSIIDDSGGIVSVSYSLVRGSKAVCNSILSWIESTCGCRVSTKGFSPNPPDLAAILAHWTIVNEKNTFVKRPLELSFSVPKHITGLRKLTLAIPQASLNSLYQAILQHQPKGSSKETARSQNEQEISEKDKKEIPVLRALECFIKEAFHIDIRSFGLTQLTAPHAVFDSDGRCKIIDKGWTSDVLFQIDSMVQNRVRN